MTRFLLAAFLTAAASPAFAACGTDGMPPEMFRAFVTGAQEALNEQVVELQRTREEVRVGLAEQKRLREIISPDKAVNPQAQPLREVTRGAWSAMVDSDRRLSEGRPTLVSEIMLLMGLQQRNTDLKKRTDQLKQEKTSIHGAAINNNFVPSP